MRSEAHTLALAVSPFSVPRIPVCGVSCEDVCEGFEGLAFEIEVKLLGVLEAPVPKHARLGDEACFLETNALVHRAAGIV